MENAWPDSEVGRELAKRNIKVCFTYFKNEKNAKKIIDEIKGAGGLAEAKKMDIRNIGSIKKTLDYFLKKNSKISILINNSGISQIKSFNFIFLIKVMNIQNRCTTNSLSSSNNLFFHIRRHIMVKY